MFGLFAEKFPQNQEELACISEIVNCCVIDIIDNWLVLDQWKDLSWPSTRALRTTTQCVCYFNCSITKNTWSCWYKKRLKLFTNLQAIHCAFVACPCFGGLWKTIRPKVHPYFLFVVECALFALGIGRQFFHKFSLFFLFPNN